MNNQGLNVSIFARQELLTARSGQPAERVTRHVVLVFENGAFGCFWNNSAKNKTKTLVPHFLEHFLWFLSDLK